MRVHLRGVVISVGVLLLLVVVVTVFNAYDSSTSPQVRGRQAGRPGGRVALRSADQAADTAAGASRARKSPAPRARSSKISPRSSARLGPSGRAAGGAARGASPSRAAGASGVRRGPMRNEETADTAPVRPRGGSRQAVEHMNQAEEVETTAATRAARGRSRAGPPNARGGKRQEDDDTPAEPEASAQKKSHQPKYPEWWEVSYPRSHVNGLQETFVGDGPLYPECATQVTVPKLERFGFVEPPNYMTNSKNPCWFENSGKKDLLRCVPYFYVAGVAECGTSDLMNRIMMHPDVMPGAAKAYYWWDRVRYGASAALRFTRENKRTDGPVPVRDYAKNVVGDSGRNLTRQLLYDGKSHAIFGDASPTYLVENTQWDIFEGNDGCLEPRIIPGSFIRHMYPDSRIIIMLRQPVDRVYARFLARIPIVEQFENATASLFHTFLVQAVQNYMACFARFSIRQCAYNASLFANAVVRLSEGMYPVFLEDWLRIFPPENVLIIRFEDYTQDVPGHVQKVFEFLGLEPLDHVTMLKIADAHFVKRGTPPEVAGYMLQESVKILTEFYSPFLTKLAHMLDDRKWLFDDVPPPPVATIQQQGYPQPGEISPQGTEGREPPPQREAPAEAGAGDESLQQEQHRQQEGSVARNEAEDNDDDANEEDKFDV